MDPQNQSNSEENKISDLNLSSEKVDTVVAMKQPLLKNIGNNDVFLQMD